MKLVHGSIRKKITILVLLATMPVFLALLATGLLSRRQAVDRACENSMLILHGFAEVQRRVTEFTGNLLHSVAGIPDIIELHPQRSGIILENLLASHSIYQNIILLNAQGTLVAAGKHSEQLEKISFSQHSSFLQSLNFDGAIPGEFIFGSICEKPVVPCAKAVRDGDGELRGVLVIAIDLGHLRRVLEQSNFPDGAFVGLCDREGVRLFRYPALEDTPQGAPVVHKVFQAATSTTEPDSLIVRASDGKKRIVSFEPLILPGHSQPYMYMFMGRDYELVMRDAHNFFFRVMGTALFSLVLTLTIGWLVGNHAIGSHLVRLTRLTKTVGQNKFSVVSGLDYTDGEIGSLAMSFDSMVSQLARREMERIEADNKLRASEERFRKLLEDVSLISIQGYDEQRRVIFWNDASEKLYGYSKEEAIGRRVEELVIPESMRDEVIRLHSRWLDYGEKIPAGELILVDKSGKDVPVYSSHVMDHNIFGKEMYCVDIDLRPLRRSEADRQELEARLRQAQKMEAIGTLAGGIAHDFNNILAPIAGNAELLLAEFAGDNKEARQSLEQILSSTLRAKELVQQILSFSRQESIHYQPVKLQSVIEEIVQLLHSVIPRNVTIISELNPVCDPVVADTTQLHQVIMNLATNAVYAMTEDGGELHIGLDQCEIDEHRSHILGIQPGPTACLSVVDTGSGIPEELIDKIFNPFFTTKEKGIGTGIGLSVVHEIVKHMKGSVTVKSKQGQGTEFVIYIPTVKAVVGQTKDEQRLMRASQPGEKRILLIDDEEAILTLNQRLLTGLGYVVTSFNSPIEALQVFTEEPHVFDLVISDVSMPEMSGDTLVTEILRIRPEIPIILCTGYCERMDEQTVRALGVKEVLMKPVSLKELSFIVHRLLEKEEEGPPEGKC